MLPKPGERLAELLILGRHLIFVGQKDNIKAGLRERKRTKR